jgi:undecaprenyl-diphosphatase
MIELLKAATLGVVEGLTEFIPVSSTGHLIVGSRVLGWGDPTFEIFIQLGAIVALTWEYREPLRRLAVDAAAPGPARRFLLHVLIAFLPAAVVGLLAHRWIEEHLFSVGTVATSLIVGGVLIFVIDGPGRRGSVSRVTDVTLPQAVSVGLGQVLSLIPGVSRAGATILTGLVVGLERRAATEFSFFLALPTLYAACLFTLWKSRHDLDASGAIALAVGFLAAFVSALVVIRALLRFVQTHDLRPFGWYRIAAGVAVLIWLALGR